MLGSIFFLILGSAGLYFGSEWLIDGAKALAKKLTAAFIKSIPDLNRKAPWIKSALYGETDDKKMGFCAVGMKFHPGAIEAFEEAGRKIPACAKP